MVDFSNLYKVNVPVTGRCEVGLAGERMEEMKEFKYLGKVLCKHGEMDGEKRKRDLCKIEVL